MFSQVLLKSLPKSVLAPWRAVLTAGFPKVWDNIPRLLVDPLCWIRALYQALKAFRQVPKSLFILQVIDDPVLRQAIEKQLDRIEHVHRFTRPSRSAIHGNFYRRRKRTRRWRKPASGSSKTASSAGTISNCRKSWKRSRMPRPGRWLSMLWHTAR